MATPTAAPTIMSSLAGAAYTSAMTVPAKLSPFDTIGLLPPMLPPMPPFPPPPPPHERASSASASQAYMILVVSTLLGIVSGLLLAFVIYEFAIWRPRRERMYRLATAEAVETALEVYAGTSRPPPLEMTARIVHVNGDYRLKDNGKDADTDAGTVTGTVGEKEKEEYGNAEAMV